MPTPKKASPKVRAAEELKRYNQKLTKLKTFECTGLGWTHNLKPSPVKTPPEDHVLENSSMVSLRIIYKDEDEKNKADDGYCGGSVIDSNYIVTASHCIASDISWKRVEVIYGDESLDGHYAHKTYVEKAFCHIGFVYETLDDDIAILKLKDPLPDWIAPMKMDSQDAFFLKEGTEAVAYGWPVRGRKAGDRRLNKTHLKVKNIDMKSFIDLSNSKNPEGGLCRGESGGPLIVTVADGTKILAGVFSGIDGDTENDEGKLCMKLNYKMFFTPIAKYRVWIDNLVDYLKVKDIQGNVTAP